jgi:hypothetical protein
LPAKSVAQWWIAWGPSLKRLVSIAAPPETARPQGRIWVARHSLPIRDLAHGYSVRLTRAPSTAVSPKRTPPPTSPPWKLTPWVPRRHPPAVNSPPIAALGGRLSSIVIVSARIAAKEPGSRLHHLLSARAQSNRSSSAGWAGLNPATNSRGVVSVAAAWAKTSKSPLQVPTPMRCSIPSWRACHHVPRTCEMAVPAGASQRQRAKRVPDTVD